MEAEGVERLRQEVMGATMVLRQAAESEAMVLQIQSPVWYMLVEVEAAWTIINPFIVPEAVVEAATEGTMV